MTAFVIIPKAADNMLMETHFDAEPARGTAFFDPLGKGSQEMAVIRDATGSEWTFLWHCNFF
jgi:hypothetical protein